MPRPQNVKAREKILEAAAELFHKRGFNGVSMDDVAQASRMKKANLFHYYPTKEDLGLAVMERRGGYYKEMIRAHFAGPGDPIEVVDGLFKWSAGVFKENGCARGCIIGNFAQELSDGHAAIRRSVEGCIQSWVAAVSEHLERWKEKGYFKASLKPKGAGEAVISLLEGALLVGKAGKSVKPIDNARLMAREFLLGHKATQGG